MTEAWELIEKLWTALKERSCADAEKAKRIVMLDEADFKAAAEPVLLALFRLLEERTRERDQWWRLVVNGETYKANEARAETAERLLEEVVGVIEGAAQPPAKPSNKGFNLEQARLISGWRDGESRALAIAVMALRSIESQEPDTHELTLAHQMAQSAREALTLIQEVMEP